ncbi:hypothetical protein ACQP2K_07345 [Microbispora siamensis]
MPAAVGRTAYRIAQESLTNIARHASATTASRLLATQRLITPGRRAGAVRGRMAA